LLLVPALSRAQFGGVVFDPTKLQERVAPVTFNSNSSFSQLKQTYQQVWSHYQLALQMSKNLQNMPARYRATFSQWRTFTANDF